MRREIFIYEILLLSDSDIGLKPHQFPIKALHNTQLSLYQNIYIYVYIHNTNERKPVKERNK